MFKSLWERKQQRNILVLCSDGSKATSFVKKVVKSLFPNDKHKYFMVGIESKTCVADISREGWTTLPCKNGKSLDQYTFDIVISEFCPIHSIPDTKESAFSVETIDEISKIVNLTHNPYLVVPLWNGDDSLFEINFGDRSHMVPLPLAEHLMELKGEDVLAAFIPIVKLIRQIKSWQRLYQIKKQKQQQKKIKI